VNARVVLNAAPMPKPGDPTLEDLLRTVDVLIVNETEAAALANRPTTAWASIAESLCDLGPSACVITLGSKGAVAHDGTTGWAQPAYPAEVVDTTGAGDAFCGSLAAALAAGVQLPEAVRRGCAAGALATGRLGAQAALPSRADLEAFMGGEV
jgi:ribokinase